MGSPAEYSSRSRSSWLALSPTWPREALQGSTATAVKCLVEHCWTIISNAFFEAILNLRQVLCDILQLQGKAQSLPKLQRNVVPNRSEASEPSPACGFKAKKTTWIASRSVKCVQMWKTKRDPWGSLACFDGQNSSASKPPAEEHQIAD